MPHASFPRAPRGPVRKVSGPLVSRRPEPQGDASRVSPQSAQFDQSEPQASKPQTRHESQRDNPQQVHEAHPWPSKAKHESDGKLQQSQHAHGPDAQSPQQPTHEEGPQEDDTLLSGREQPLGKARHLRHLATNELTLTLCQISRDAPTFHNAHGKQDEPHTELPQPGGGRPPSQKGGEAPPLFHYQKPASPEASKTQSRQIPRRP